MRGATPEWHITPPLFRALLRRHRAGDAAALAELVARMAPIIWKRAWRFARHAEVEDLAQQGVVLLLEVLPKIRTGRGAAPVNYVARHIATGLYRYCRVACPASRPLTITHLGNLVPAAHVASEGRMASGERNGSARLNAKKVAEIRQRYAAGGVSHRKLAEQYGVSPSAIRRVVRREYWRGVGT